MYRTLGAPSGALGWRNGAQSGTESRSSMLMVPLNRLVMTRGSQPVEARASSRRGESARSRRGRKISGDPGTAAGARVDPEGPADRGHPVGEIGQPGPSLRAHRVEPGAVVLDGE